MFPYKTVLFMTGALFLLLAVAAGAEPVAEARKAIETLYQKQDAAFESRDVDGYLASNAASYQITNRRGKVVIRSGAKLRASTSQWLSSSEAIVYHTIIQKFQRMGAQAVSTVKQHIEWTTVNPNTQIPIKVIVDGVSEDRWTQSGKTWLRTRSHILSWTMRGGSPKS